MEKEYKIQFEIEFPLISNFKMSCCVLISKELLKTVYFADDKILKIVQDTVAKTTTKTVERLLLTGLSTINAEKPTNPLNP